MDITFDLARALTEKALGLAGEKQANIAVAVVDAHGELVSFARMDGVAFHAAVLAKNKAYTSARDRQPTANLAAWAQETGKDMGYWSDARFTGIQGGVPIYLDDQVVGALGISGMSEQDDATLAQAAIDTCV
ncbi:MULTISPECIES: GlcG/HbpS family heme-binding protein [unclassified Agarivorans]|uniref:GlcG/HbpS family heme-binding protein n=1 Tax=unclassified Agarivorans TaxID=2636026 RepID=UPI0026E27C2C|nr:MULTISPECIES: heme-binding protein [unclassified Agarivorans]MDO6685125.1 heme-binding protein [Agarivorans sp. 3_MG-2023]MDO6715703.1 heme-binding protein [Agarivorans sp. 2_MG-2023]